MSEVNKALFIVSSKAQIEMFKPIVDHLNDYKIKFINTEIFFILKEIELLLNKYNFDYENIDNWNMKSVDKILRSENPDIIVSGNDQHLMDILFIKAANNMEIPSLTVQDGILITNRCINQPISIKLRQIIAMPFRVLKNILNINYPLQYKISYLLFDLRYKKDYSFIYGHGESTKIALFGENIKNTLISEGVSSEKLEVTGSSKFDDLIQFKDPSRRENIKKKFGIHSEKKIVLVLTQWFVEAGMWTTEQRRIFICEIVKACSNLENVQLILKIHPHYEKKSEYNKILKNSLNSVLICKSEPVHEIISIADVVISVKSTTALEAMVLRKPVLIINLYNDQGTHLFKEAGVLYIEKVNAIQPSLKRLLYHPNEFVDKDKMNKFIYDQAYLVDGNASKRISDLIRTIIYSKDIK